MIKKIEKNIVFLSEHSEENIKFGNFFYQKGYSNTGYWFGEQEVSFDGIITNSGVFRVKTEEEQFKNFIFSFISDLGYIPDLLIVKGSIFDLWAVSSLIKEGYFNFPCVSIIDKFDIPFSGFDFMILDQFDFNLFLDDDNDHNKYYFDIVKKMINKIKIIKGFYLKNCNYKYIIEQINIFLDEQKDKSISGEDIS